jgi:hypothetical protein
MQTITYLTPTKVNLENGFNYPGDASLSFKSVMFKASDGTTKLLPLDTRNLLDSTINEIFNESITFKTELLGEIKDRDSNLNNLINILNNVNTKITNHFRTSGGSRKLNKSSKSKKFKKSKSRKH